VWHGTASRGEAGMETTRRDMQDNDHRGQPAATLPATRRNAAPLLDHLPAFYWTVCRDQTSSIVDGRAGNDN